MKNFAIIGVGGYIAPRHLKAIKETDNRLVAALDKNDSVGILDKFFDDVDFFTEFERFDRHIVKLKGTEKQIDYVTICTPNYLHDSHIRFALRNGADAICEKPLVLNPWNLDQLEEIEKKSEKKVYTVLQLRSHPTIQKIREKYQNSEETVDIDLTYITPRGKWYDYSWKGHMEKAGGVATNIGIHFFDMLIWIFGNPKKSEVHYSDEHKMTGFIELERARIKWYLSIDKNDLPDSAQGQPYRSITIDEEEVEFSDGFTDLHTQVYKDIFDGKGHGIKDARPSITLVHEIRNADVKEPSQGKEHPFFEKTKRK